MPAQTATPLWTGPGKEALVMLFRVPKVTESDTVDLSTWFNKVNVAVAVQVTNGTPASITTAISVNTTVTLTHTTGSSLSLDAVYLLVEGSGV